MWKRLAVVLAVLLLTVGAWAFLAQRYGPTTDVMRADTQEPASPMARKVLMVPGYGGGESELRGLGSKLAAAGIDWAIIDVGDGKGDLKKYARKVRNRAAKLRATDHAVDLIGYSAGGITARIAATSHPDDFRRVVTLSAPHHGTALAELGAVFGECPKACQQIRPGSRLLDWLEGRFEGPDSDWLSIYSSTDKVIRPPRSSELDGAEVESIQETCTDVKVRHGEVPKHRQTAAMVVAFLDGQPLPDACVA